MVRKLVHTLQERFATLAALTGEIRTPMLAPPATAEALARVEQALGPLPRELRSLLAIADGWTDVPMSEQPMKWFSCDDLLSPSYAAFVAKVRRTRGFMRDRNVQQGFLFGGNDDEVVLLSPGAAPEIILHGLRPRTQGVSGPPARFFEIWITSIDWRIEEAHKKAARSKDPKALVDEAIAAFNYPGEMGDDVHDSVESVSAIVDELADTTYAPALRRLLAELVRGYDGSMRFAVARRRKDRIEVQVEGRWIAIERAPS